MERICERLKDRIMSPMEAAQLIKTGMTVGMSGFTIVGYPKEVPLALAESGHAKELTVLIGASVGDEIDGAMTRAGIIKKRFSYQSNSTMRKEINAGNMGYQDMHVSHFPKLINEGTGPHIDVAVVDCAAIVEGGLIPSIAVGCADAVVRMADKVIVEINESLPEEFIGLHDIFEVGTAPNSKPIPITRPLDRVGTSFIPCDFDKIAAVVITDKYDQGPRFKDIDETSAQVGANVVKFMKEEVEAGRLPANIGPLQSGVGSIGNAVLSCLAEGGFRNLEMYTEVMQDAAVRLIDEGVISAVSASALSLCRDTLDHFYENISFYKDKIVIRPQEISNHPEVIRRLGSIAINTPIEVDIYGNVNSTHISGTSMMNGIGGSGDYTRNARISIFSTPSTAKDGKISSIVPMVSHVDHTEHDVQVVVTEWGIADLRWTTPTERAELIIENCAHPDYRPMLRDYFERAKAVSKGKYTPHILSEALSWHERYLETGSMK